LIVDKIFFPKFQLLLVKTNNRQKIETTHRKLRSIVTNADINKLEFHHSSLIVGAKDIISDYIKLTTVYNEDNTLIVINNEDKSDDSIKTISHTNLHLGYFIMKTIGR